MKKVTININGSLTSALMFSTKKSADKYCAKTNKSVVFYRAHEYYVA